MPIVALLSLTTLAESKDKADALLSITIAMQDSSHLGYVGQEIKVVVTLTNSGSESLAVLRDHSIPAQPAIVCRVNVDAIPGQKQCDILTGPSADLAVGWVKPDAFLIIPPHKSISITCTDLIPMFPGDATLSAALRQHLRSTEPVTQDGVQAHVWSGIVSGVMDLKISDKPFRGLAERYAKLTQDILTSNLPQEHRLAALLDISKDRHYFAAEQIRQILPKVSDPVIRDAATRQLIDLLKFGTAYRAWPDLIQILGRDDVPEATQRQLLNTISAIDLTMDPVAYRIGGQATYVMPTTTKQLLIQQLQQLSKGRNPYLASEANVILKKALKPQH